MRALWSGSISFGLVNIPVKLFSAAESHDGLDFRLLHKTDHAPIRYARFCTKENVEVEYKDIVKAYEVEKGQFVVLAPEDFEAADPAQTSAIDIVEFAAEDQIDVRYLERPYYLEPGRGAEKPYALLREALRQSGKLGVARFVMHEREHLALIKPVGAALVLNQMRFPADLRTPGGLKLPHGQKPGDQELAMALKLINQLTEPFVPEDFHDTYTEKLQARIQAKLKGHPTPTHATATTEPVKDLMAALKASLEGNN